MASSKSSFSAFNEVDESVAKPVLGSDGAARWQNFSKNAKLPTTTSVAPAMPLKKLDRALGTKSIRDEQINEDKIRKEAGDSEQGSGYTVFKRKSDHEEVAEQKKKKLVMDKGHRDYWDGADSVRKELGLPPIHIANGSSNAAEGDYNAGQPKKKLKTKKKKKKAREAAEVPEIDQFNPMEQVAQAILRREQAMGGPPSSLLSADNRQADAAALGADSSALNIASTSAPETLEPELVAAGWESTKDPNSGKTYYFRRTTNERSWTKPDLPKQPVEMNNEVPDGWKSTKDKSSGKVYYYHTSGKTSWEKPKS